MAINSVQGASAYTNAINSAPPVDETTTRNQNIEASRTELDTQSSAVAQQAFEVNITQEAQDRLAREESQQRAQEAQQARDTQQAQQDQAAQQTEQQTPPPEQMSGQDPVTSSRNGQIANIVA